MKKLLAIILAILMLLSFAACDAETSIDDGDVTNSSQNDNTDNTDNADNTDNTDNTDSSDNTNNTDNTEDTNTTELSFTELVAVDNAECLIKITGIEPDAWFGYTLNVQLENKSSEKAYMFSIDRSSVNGVQCSALFATEVAAGKKANDTITIPADDLEENGVDVFTDIELTFRVYDNNDWLAEDAANETIHVYPYGEDKATKFVREAKASDTVIVDNEYVTAIVTGYEEDDLWGYVANVFLLNKTEKDIVVTADDVSVNGFMAEPYFSTTVYAEKCKFDSIDWSKTTLEKNSITEVEEIEFVFRVYDSDNWLGEDYVNETITLNP